MYILICVTIYCILIEFFILPAYNICHSKHSFSIHHYHRSLAWHSKQFVNLICLFHAGSWMSNKVNVMRCRLLFTLFAVRVVCLCVHIHIYIYTIILGWVKKTYVDFAGNWVLFKRGLLRFFRKPNPLKDINRWSLTILRQSFFFLIL